MDKFTAIEEHPGTKIASVTVEIGDCVAVGGISDIGGAHKPLARRVDKNYAAVPGKYVLTANTDSVTILHEKHTGYAAPNGPDYTTISFARWDWNAACEMWPFRAQCKLLFVAAGGAEKLRAHWKVSDEAIPIGKAHAAKCGFCFDVGSGGADAGITTTLLFYKNKLCGMRHILT